MPRTCITGSPCRAKIKAQASIIQLFAGATHLTVRPPAPPAAATTQYIGFPQTLCVHTLGLFRLEQKELISAECSPRGMPGASLGCGSLVGGSHCGAMHSLRSYPISIHSPARAPFCGDACFIGNYFAARHVCILPIHAGQRLAHTSDRRRCTGTSFFQWL